MIHSGRVQLDKTHTHIGGLDTAPLKLNRPAVCVCNPLFAIPLYATQRVMTAADRPAVVWAKLAV